GGCRSRKAAQERNEVKILVTGADGFAGTHMVRILRARGDTVDACAGPGLPGGLDVTSSLAVEARVAESRPDAVIHLAGFSSVAGSHEQPALAISTNVLGAANVLQGVRQHTPKARVMLVGSGEVYGRLPTGQRAKEGNRVNPLSPYAASKLAAEVVGQQMVAS